MVDVPQLKSRQLDESWKTVLIFFHEFHECKYPSGYLEFANILKRPPRLSALLAGKRFLATKESDLFALFSKKIKVAGQDAQPVESIE